MFSTSSSRIKIKSHFFPQIISWCQEKLCLSTLTYFVSSLCILLSCILVLWGFHLFMDKGRQVVEVFINFSSIFAHFPASILRYLVDCSLLECDKELELFGLMNVFPVNNVKLQNLIPFFQFNLIHFIKLKNYVNIHNKFTINKIIKLYIKLKT
jgi:hypothetical protein